MSVYTLESFITPELVVPNYANPLFRAVGYNAILALFFLGVDSRIASEFSLYHCTLHSLVRGPVCPHGTHPGPLGPSCPSRSGARQATPRRFHSGTEPFGSTPWRRPVRSLDPRSNAAALDGCSRAPKIQPACFTHYNSRTPRICGTRNPSHPRGRGEGWNWRIRTGPACKVPKGPRILRGPRTGGPLDRTTA